MNNLTLCKFSLKNVRGKRLIIEVIYRKLFQHLLTWIKRSSPEAAYQIKLATTNEQTDEQMNRRSHWWTDKPWSTLLLVLIENIYIHTNICIYGIQPAEHVNRHTESKTRRQTDKHGDRPTDRPRDRLRDRPRDRWIDGQTDIHKGRQETYRYTCIVYFIFSIGNVANIWTKYKWEKGYKAKVYRDGLYMCLCYVRIIF